jgi:hypothetical protein
MLLFLTAGGFIASRVIDRGRGREKAAALFGGAEDVELERFEIEYQQRRVVCSDPVALRFLEECLRRGDTRCAQPGTSCRFRLWFSGGGAFKAETYWFAGGFSIRMPDRAAGGLHGRHGVCLPKPMPSQVKEMVDSLDRPWEEVRGTVLVLEPAGVRREHDITLVAR